MTTGGSFMVWRERQEADPGAVSRRSPTAESGFTLVEALVTLFILTLILLSLGQLIAMGMVTNKGAEHLTTATGLSTAKLEELRSGDYWALTTGGSLNGNSTDYFDEPDVDGDGVADFTRRWEVSEQTGSKLIKVRVISNIRAIGQPKQATLAAVIAEP